MACYRFDSSPAWHHSRGYWRRLEVSVDSVKSLLLRLKSHVVDDLFLADY